MLRALNKVLKYGCVVIGLAAVGCGAATRNYSDLNTYNPTVTMLIVNQGFDDVRVYGDMGRVASVSSGRTKCIVITSPQQTARYSYVPFASRTKWFAEPRNFGSSYGWIWRIDSHLPGLSTFASMIPGPRCGPWGEADRLAELRTIHNNT